jgi:hypothetical protein
MKKTALYTLLIFLIAAGCREEYKSPAVLRETNFLVVEGVINVGSDTTFIVLTRSRKLIDSVNIIVERNAQVFVEVQNGPRIQLQPYTTDGTYYAPGLNLSADKLCRLYIKTRNKEYISDYVPVKQTPAIESVYAKKENGNIQISLNTKDPQNKTIYYRWDYEETWEFKSPLSSTVIFDPVDSIIVPRKPDEYFLTCWASEKSGAILVNSSLGASQDVISAQPMSLITPANSEKLSVRYSILVKQYALTKEAFQYWNVIKKNSEQVGSIFDPLPSQQFGNIRCITDPSEPVIGFVSASTIFQKRFFINKNDVDPWLVEVQGCKQGSYFNVSASNLDSFYTFLGPRGGYTPVFLAVDGDGVPRWRSYLKKCVDCITRGTNKKPVYW